MASPLRVTFARLCFDTRTMLDISQSALAEAAGVSRGYIATIESGRANPTFEVATRIADRLGIELDLVARPPLVISPRQHDRVHARCSGYADRRFRRAGWEVQREVEVVHGRSHGWIDLLAFDPRTGTLLIVELKTRFDDLGAIERQLSWYERSASDLARRFGLRIRHVMSWLILLASEEVDTAIRVNTDALGAAFPARAAEMMAIVGTSSSPGGIWTPGGSSRGMALIDPASKRREWLLKSRVDGRRAVAPYRDYVDAARRFGG